MKKIIAALLSLVLTAFSVLPAQAAAGTDDVLAESLKAAERSSGKYYYNYLGTMKNGAAYQELYNKLYDLALSLIESDTDFETDGFAIHFDASTPIKWEYDAGKLTYSESLAVSNMFGEDNPYFYFMNVLLNENEIKIFDNYSFHSASERKETFRKINSYLGSYSEAETIDDPYKKAEFIHDRICLDMTYAHDLYLHPEYTGWEANIYGAVMYRTGVCNGYAHLFTLVSQYYGFSSPIVWGVGADDVNDPDTHEAHVWNIMSLDGKRYYYIDTTWDDKDPVHNEWSEYFSHEFFLCGPKELRGHIRENNPEDNDICKSDMSEIYLPNISGMSYLDEKAEMEAHPELYTEPVTEISETDPPESEPVTEAESSEASAGTAETAADTSAETAPETESETTADTTAASADVKETTEESPSGVTTVGSTEPAKPAQNNTPIIIAAVVGGVAVVAAVIIVIVLKRKKK